MAGAVIGNYQLGAKLGEGGMGAVFLAHHTLLGRRAAIKILLPTLSARQDIVNRFFNEARAVTSISDPGIVQVYDFGYAPDGSAYIVMEYLEGESLYQRLARLGRLTASDAIRLCRQIASSLAAAHARHIVHRDLKPENVYLVPDVEVASGERTKILDFGIAKLADDDPGRMKTSTGMLVGTPAYMSPEQCRGITTVDHRSDIYSLGCVLFHLLTGRPPFVGEGPGDVLSAHIREQPPRPSLLAAGISSALDATVLRCLEKSPDQRYLAMTNVVGALTDLLQSHPASGPSFPAPSYAASSPTLAHPAQTGPTTLGASAGQLRFPADANPSVRRSRRLPLVAGAIVAIVVVVVAAAVSRGNKRALDEVPAPPRSPTSASREISPVGSPHPAEPPAGATGLPAAPGAPAVPSPGTTPSPAPAAPPAPAPAPAAPPSPEAPTMPPPTPAPHPSAGRARPAPSKPPASATPAPPHVPKAPPKHQDAPSPAPLATPSCARSTFASVYDAADPPPGAARAALRALKLCRDSKAIGDAEFEQIQALLVAKL